MRVSDTSAAALLALGLLASPVASAQTPGVGTAAGSRVAVTQAWARATPPHATTGAVYMTFISSMNDRFISASSLAATTAQLHETRMDGTVMRMRPVEGGLDLPAGKPVTLAPGGYHLMLVDLKQPLKPGDGVPLHLSFAHAPPLDVIAQVKPIGTDGSHGGGTSMPGMSMGK